MKEVGRGGIEEDEDIVRIGHMGGFGILCLREIHIRIGGEVEETDHGTVDEDREPAVGDTVSDEFDEEVIGENREIMDNFLGNQDIISNDSTFDKARLGRTNQTGEEKIVTHAKHLREDLIRRNTEANGPKISPRGGVGGFRDKRAGGGGVRFGEGAEEEEISGGFQDISRNDVPAGFVKMGIETVGSRHTITIHAKNSSLDFIKGGGGTQSVFVRISDNGRNNIGVNRRELKAIRRENGGKIVDGRSVNRGGTGDENDLVSNLMYARFSAITFDEVMKELDKVRFKRAFLCFKSMRLSVEGLRSTLEPVDFLEEFVDTGGRGRDGPRGFHRVNEIMVTGPHILEAEGGFGLNGEGVEFENEGVVVGDSAGEVSDSGRRESVVPQRRKKNHVDPPPNRVLIEGMRGGTTFLLVRVKKDVKVATNHPRFVMIANREEVVPKETTTNFRALAVNNGEKERGRRESRNLVISVGDNLTKIEQPTKVVVMKVNFRLNEGKEIENDEKSFGEVWGRRRWEGQESRRDFTSTSEGSGGEAREKSKELGRVGELEESWSEEDSETDSGVEVSTRFDLGLGSRVKDLILPLGSGCGLDLEWREKLGGLGAIPKIEVPTLETEGGGRGKVKIWGGVDKWMVKRRRLLWA
ncbi:transposon tx1 uncharacterized 149 kDa protein [Phtheirospermum japonicum]|uniref:Transposon tx1 uncharacterized 149 kDa protein n=1 Tax=Phtheirospermum japonicum TaxID=374723 RepID=A0A830B9S6_9LAMI|nr:transposon tx1 uncharacterized 149 kDa protein [Phtheirospermum japonicum]